MYTTIILFIFIMIIFNNNNRKMTVDDLTNWHEEIILYLQLNKKEFKRSELPILEEQIDETKRAFIVRIFI